MLIPFDRNEILPPHPLVQRRGYYSPILIFAANLKPGQGFDVDCWDKIDRNKTLCSIQWFKKKHGLPLDIRPAGEKKIRILSISA